MILPPDTVIDENAKNTHYSSDEYEVFTLPEMSPPPQQTGLDLATSTAPLAEPQPSTSTGGLTPGGSDYISSSPGTAPMTPSQQPDEPQPSTSTGGITSGLTESPPSSPVPMSTPSWVWIP